MFDQIQMLNSISGRYNGYLDKYLVGYRMPEKSGGFFKLEVFRAGYRDSGQYTCAPDEAPEDVINLHVIEGICIFDLMTKEHLYSLYCMSMSKTRNTYSVSQGCRSGWFSRIRCYSLPGLIYITPDSLHPDPNSL